MKKNTVIESLSLRSAKVRLNLQKRRAMRWFGGRGLATLALGATLSVGGVTEAFQNVHFVILKDLDAVRLMKQDGNKKAEVVARIQDGFAADSLFKLNRALPNRMVSQKLALFDDRWLPIPSEIVESVPAASDQPPSAFHEELRLINTAIRREFFANAVPFGDLIHTKAEKYNVDPALVAAVVENESRFHSRARSQVGAQGLMQLMPRTGRWLGARNLYDPEQNVDAGAKYLRYLNQRFDGNLKKTIAAYNAGEGNVRRYKGVPPFRETRSYVRKVMSTYENRKKQLEDYKDGHVQAPAAVPAEEMTLR